MKRNSVKFSLVPLMALVVTACGGSDGGDGGGSVHLAPLTLTEENVRPVSKEVINNLDDNDIGIVPVDQFRSYSSPENISAIDLLQRTVDFALEKSAQDQSMARVAISDDCPGGGSFTVSASSSYQSEPAPGDWLSIEANNCVVNDTTGGQAYSTRMNGSAKITFQAATSFPPRSDFPNDPSWSFSSLDNQEQVHLAFDAFSIDLTGAESGAMHFDGGMTLKTGETFMSLEYGLISGNVSVNVSSPAEGVNFSMSNPYLESITRTDNLNEFSEALYNVSYSSTAIGGMVTVTTIQSLIHDEATGNPLESGKVKLTGASNTSVTLTVPSDVLDVQLEIDNNGDGITDTTSHLTWEEFNQ